MNRMLRGFGSMAAVGVVFVAGLGGCDSEAGDREAELGSLSLPLAASAPSRTRYQLRDATFEIRSGYYYGGEAGYYDDSESVVTVHSEDEDPNASAITVLLEQGRYNVRLLPGWKLQKVDGDTATDVEASLLSSQTVSVRVSPNSTTWAEYHFGVGDSDLWFNGKLNLNIRVYEDPHEYYGGGYGGAGGAGGYDPGWGGSEPGWGGAGGGG